MISVIGSENMHKNADGHTHAKDNLEDKKNNFFTECAGNNKGTSDKTYFEFFDKKML
tara:strand:+ start:420 stop:590 length:171 start_codon:yes stop_codon:yes gene_type:complete